MADYKELLGRAILALPEYNGAARRAVYEKARSSLVGQLRAITPPISAREITHHRLQLEDCILQVEKQASHGREEFVQLAAAYATALRSKEAKARPPKQVPVLKETEPGAISIEEIIAKASALSGPQQSLPAAAPATNAELVEPKVASQGGETYIIRPTAFRTPLVAQEVDFVSAMMPFSPDFNPVWKAIQRAVSKVDWRSSRADEIWEDQIIIEDVFGLIFRSQVVICDFSGKNPNVFYEAGIAHTLGRVVIPIVQDMSDLPFDLKHHRTLRYDNTQSGRTKLAKELAKRLTFFGISESSSRNLRTLWWRAERRDHPQPE